MEAKTKLDIVVSAYEGSIPSNTCAGGLLHCPKAGLSHGSQSLGPRLGSSAVVWPTQDVSSYTNSKPHVLYEIVDLDLRELHIPVIGTLPCLDN